MNKPNFKSFLKTKGPRSLGVYLLTGTLIASLVFVVITFYVLARLISHEQAWVLLATDVQVTSQQLAKSAGEAAGGNVDAFTELANTRIKITAAMNELRAGSMAVALNTTAGEIGITGALSNLDTAAASHDFSGADGKVATALQRLNLTWRNINSDAAKILDRQQLVLTTASAHKRVQKNIAGIQKNTDLITRTLTQSGAPSNQVVYASRQLVVAGQLLQRVSELLHGANNPTAAADSVRKDKNRFDQILGALSDGSERLGVTPLQEPQAVALLAKVKSQYRATKPQIAALLTASGDLLQVHQAADEIFVNSHTVLKQADTLKSAITAIPQSRLWPSQMSGIIGLVVMTLCIWMLIFSFLWAERRRAKIAAKTNKKNQQAILRLLDEMSSLADGDLTVEVSVRDEITGAIADSINYAIEQLRELVKGIKFTAQEVASSAMGTRASTSELASTAVLQAKQVGEASKTVQTIALSFDSMAKRSQESSDAARRAVAIANNGGEKVRETINGMDTIREQIQQTSKRIKRLGESTQEIGDIVEMINNIAEQTNVLALNAAIQAASTGGSGKGFAVVADEVQQLAESATRATRRIETLVQTIQADTYEAVVSMESTTSEVVSGARLAEDAGQALEQIESVSTDLSGLIVSISEEAQAQSASASGIAELMNNIQTVSVQASEGSSQVANSVESLANLVMQLSDSVTDFKLPEDA